MKFSSSLRDRCFGKSVKMYDLLNLYDNIWNQKHKARTTFYHWKILSIITERTGHRPIWMVMGESWGASAGEGQRTLLSPGVSCSLQSAVRWNGSTASQLIAAHQLIIATSDWTAFNRLSKTTQVRVHYGGVWKSGLRTKFAHK